MKHTERRIKMSMKVRAFGILWGLLALTACSEELGQPTANAGDGMDPGV